MLHKKSAIQSDHRREEDISKSRWSTKPRTRYRGTHLTLEIDIRPFAYQLRNVASAPKRYSAQQLETKSKVMQHVQIEDTRGASKGKSKKEAYNQLEKGFQLDCTS